MNAADLHLPHDLGVSPDLGVRHGESNPAAMLGCVLLLLSVIALIVALELIWWLVSG